MNNTISEHDSPTTTSVPNLHHCLLSALPSFDVFTDEQHDALDDEPTNAEQLSRDTIYQHNSPCPDHHKQLLDGLQLKEGNAQNTNVFQTQLNHTMTSAGEHTLWKWLEHPLTTTRDVQLRRQMRERLVSDNDASRQQLRTALATMEAEWQSLCWCWNEDKSKTELVDNLLFTGYFSSFNDMPTLVNVYHFMRICGTPLIHCLAPIVPVLLSFGMLKWAGAGMSFNECWDMSKGVFKNALWFDGGAQSNAFSSVFQHGGGGSTEHPLMNGIRKIVPKLMQSLKWIWWAVFLANIVLMIYQCYRHYKLLSLVYARTYNACSWVYHAMSMSPQYATLDASNPTHQHLQELSQWWSGTTSSYSLFTDTHAFLKAYLTLRLPVVRDACKRLLRQVGVMDALQSVDVLVNTEEGFCVPELLDTLEQEHATHTTDSTQDVEATDDNTDDTDQPTESETTGKTEEETADTNETPNTSSTPTTPTLHLTNAYHPILSTAQTKHTFALDKHIVLTGSNASGKSTVLKTMLLNVLLAQSWGVACADKMVWTPFASIRGYLHTTDDCGKESLFQAQIRRIEEFIVDAQHFEKDVQKPFSLLVVDEILNSTNPIEAMLLSYQYAKTIGTTLSDTTRMVMTTHYPVLTTLAETHRAFANWAMQPQYTIGVNKRCKASSAIGTVKQMTKVLTPEDHTSLEKAYKRMYKKLAKMRFRELDGVEEPLPKQPQAEIVIAQDKDTSFRKEEAR